MESSRILVVDDERSVREMISILLTREGHEVVSAKSGSAAIDLLEGGERFHMVITDLAMDRGSGMDVLQAVKERDSMCPVILVTAFGTTASAVEAMKLGAHDYISKPFNVDEFKLVIQHALEHRTLLRENMDLKARVRSEYRFADIIGRSSAMRDVIAVARKVARSSGTILISGESGTGKEVLARAIHFGGSRASGPFVPINCGALPEQLMESELFGHVKGAFTGATEDKTGLFEAANGGTIFLDEVGELPSPLQVKLLRVIQERTIRKVGASDEKEIDVRIVSATNRDLTESVATGGFRTDLFYRLNVINLSMPPLRERREDIPQLVSELLPRIASEIGSRVDTMSPEALRVLLKHDFPGNVRELKNLLERAAILAAGDVILPQDLPRDVLGPGHLETRDTLRLPESGADLDELLGGIEKELINQAMEKAGGVQKHAAELLGISVRSLRYRLEKKDVDS